MIKKFPPLTTIAILVTLSVVLFTVFTQKHWENEGAVIGGDAKVYYTYLPAIFVHNDIELNNLDPYIKGENQLIWYNETADSSRYIKGTYGMSLMYSPFFFMGHVLAAIQGEPMDGFSYPYRLCLSFCGAFYLLIALIFLGKLLLRYFEDHVVSVTLLVISLGTNAFFYFSEHMMYTHGPSFMLLSMLLYFSIRWFDSHKWKWTIAVGICGALLTLIRPIDFVFILFIPLLGIASAKEMKYRLQEIWKKRSHFLVIALIFIVVFTPQFMYNFHISGSIFFYSYQGESFFFGSPQIWKTLFSYRNGWLVYSPLMIFSIIGLIILFKQKKRLVLYVTVVFAVYLFLLASWWCWWYAGFGNRAFINLYPILAIPLAALIQSVFSKGIIVSTVFKSVLLIGIVLSLFQTYQFHRGAIHWGDMSKNAYWDSFLRATPSQLFGTYLQPTVIDRQKLGEDCYFAPKVKTTNYIKYSFNNSNNSDSTLTDYLLESKGIIQVPDGVEFVGNIRLFPSEEANEIYVTAWVSETCDSTFLVLRYEDQTSYQASSEVVARKNGKIQLHCYMKIPDQARGKMINFYFWNQNRKEFFCDNLSFALRKRTWYEKCID